MNREVVSSDGVRLSVRTTGHDVPVVFVHGSGGGIDSWAPVTDLLAGEFALWTYSRRCYQPSEVRPEPKAFADDVADLVAVLESAGDKAHLVGGSYGATVALHAARSGVTALRSMTLFEPPLFAAGRQLAPVLEEYRTLLDEHRYSAAARLFAANVARVPRELLGPDLGEDADTPDDSADEAVGCLHDLEAMTNDDRNVDRWRGIELPVLLIQGELTWDPMPATMNALANALSASTERAILEGQSHFATHTAPELFAERLRRFLHKH